jgi:hypothetical protein
MKNEMPRRRCPNVLVLLSAVCVLNACGKRVLTAGQLNGVPDSGSDSRIDERMISLVFPEVGIDVWTCGVGGSANGGAGGATVDPTGLVCGAVGQECCADPSNDAGEVGNPYCTASSTICVANQCVACGGACQLCCASEGAGNNGCKDGFNCVVPSTDGGGGNGQCTSCGNFQQPCCTSPNLHCNGGLGCVLWLESAATCEIVGD